MSEIPKQFLKVTAAWSEIQRLQNRVMQLEAELAKAPSKPAPTPATPVPHATGRAAGLWAEYHKLETAAERRRFWEKNRAELQKPMTYE